MGKTSPIGSGSEGRPITKHCVAGLRHTVPRGLRPHPHVHIDLRSTKAKCPRTISAWRRGDRGLVSALRSAAPASRSHAHGRHSRTTCLRHAHAHRTAPPRQVGDRFACVRPGSGDRDGDESRDRDMGLNSTHAYGSPLLSSPAACVRRATGQRCLRRRISSLYDYVLCVHTCIQHTLHTVVCMDMSGRARGPYIYPYAYIQAAPGPRTARALTSPIVYVTVVPVGRHLVATPYFF